MLSFKFYCLKLSIVGGSGVRLALTQYIWKAHIENFEYAISFACIAHLVEVPLLKGWGSNELQLTLSA